MKLPTAALPIVLSLADLLNQEKPSLPRPVITRISGAHQLKTFKRFKSFSGASPAGSDFRSIICLTTPNAG